MVHVSARRLYTPFIAMCAVLAIIPVASASAPADAQTAVSDDGVWAVGRVVNAVYPDETRRTLQVMFVVPDGPITATPATAAVDLAQPWVVVNHWEMTHGSQVCSTVRNVEHWHRGALNQARAWNGTFVDVTCDDGVYSFYRVSWDPGSSWLTTNAISLAGSGGVEGWSAAGMSGQVALRPEAKQQAKMTICAFRPGSPDHPGGFDCYGGSGIVYPANARILAHAFGAAP